MRTGKKIHLSRSRYLEAEGQSHGTVFFKTSRQDIVSRILSSSTSCLFRKQEQTPKPTNHKQAPYLRIKGLRNFSEIFEFQSCHQFNGNTGQIKNEELIYTNSSLISILLGQHHY
jgi:hypothetical protein